MTLSERIRKAVKKIPKGRIATYGQIATLCGNPRAARQVVRVLNTYAESDKLPWHRVVNRQGQIVLPPGRGFELQKAMLTDEGVLVSDIGKIDPGRFQWRPRVVRFES